MICKPKYPPKMSNAYRMWPKRTPWDPRRPVSAVGNRPPQSMWPIKYGKPVFAIDTRFDCVVSGRVAWYNPARKIDASCVTSVGHPVMNVEPIGTVSVGLVFPRTKIGWRKCLFALACLKRRGAACRREESRIAMAAAAELDSEADAIQDQALQS